MKTTLKLTSLILAIIMTASLLFGCAGKNNNASSSTSSGETTGEADAPDTYALKVGALSGPTGMGMAKLINDDKTAKKYEFTISGNPTDIQAALISENLDIAAVPVNLAAVINKKTEGKYLVAAVNTLGVLYILENGNTINSISDLAGKKLYATGQASTPEYILNHILKSNGLSTVEVEYKTDHDELATLMASGSVVLGMLPEPKVTAVLSKNSNVRVALNLTEEWKKVSDGQAVQGCVVVSKKAITEHKEIVDEFLSKYKASVDFVNNNIDEASEMIAALGIIPAAPMAKKAIPNCNIVFIEGDEMVSVLTPFYKVLFDADPKSVGGALPNESLYYKK